MAGHLAVTLAGAAAVLAAGGFGLGLAYGLTIGDLGQVPRLVGDTLAYLPAVGLMVGLGVALFGLVPRALVAIWGLLAVCFVVGFFGEILGLPRWALAVSPYEHTPLVPAEDLTAAPLLVIPGSHRPRHCRRSGAFEPATSDDPLIGPGYGRCRARVAVGEPTTRGRWPGGR